MGYYRSDAGLILPKRTGKITSHSNINIDTVMQWRKDHAHSDITSTARDLFVMLQDMHQTPMPAKTRFEILLVLKPTLAFLCDGLQKLYYRQEILSDNLRAIADLVYALNAEMLNGYKLVMHDTLKPFFFTNKKLLVAALANAMHFCIRILFHAFEQHRHPPQQSWQELHALYLFGLKRKLLERTITQNFTHSRFKNVNEMYKHFLLFAISNPHRLRKEELAHLIYAMDSWAPLLTLTPTQSAKKPSLFIVDLASDAGPKYTLFFPEPTDSCYYLDMHLITEHLQELMNNEGLLSASELSLPKPFIEALLRSWQQMAERQAKRESAEGFVNVAIGISASFYFLDQTIRNPQLSQAISAAKIKREPIKIGLPTSAEPVSSTKDQVIPNQYSCSLVDKSERGYCLKWLEEVPPQLLCGEIIGIERDGNWEVGTIRWLKHEENNVLLLGIQLLGHSTYPVKTEATHQRALLRSLIIPADESNPTDLLITPTVPFKAGQTLPLLFEGKHYQAKLDKNISQTPSFQLFSISYEGDKPPISRNPAI